MRNKKISLSNFGHSFSQEQTCYRPDNKAELLKFMQKQQPSSLLARGAGLSYSDCAFNESALIDTQRFNHFLDFDSQTGLLSCEAGIRFSELFNVHPDYIPPVIPGTLHATLAGGIANDVHGKNNHQAGSLGEHIVWLDVLIQNRIIRCSREKESALFYGTIGGLGLTGIILALGLRLRKASSCVQVQHYKYTQLEPLLIHMSEEGLQQDYQVAWLDLLNPTLRAQLSFANHCTDFTVKPEKVHRIPKLPLALVKPWTMAFFNRFYFNVYRSEQNLSLVEFNNPLDKIQDWQRLYGPKGFRQFQAVFAEDQAIEIIKQLVQLIRNAKATPTLAVLKRFTHSGVGLLSFCKPGFTLAIDFINNSAALQAIQAMNQLIAQSEGRVYLAKDLLLKPEEYRSMYPQHEAFTQLLNQYQSPMHSSLGIRLGINK
ncbi:MAG: FAD-binding oxidoreductase [Legionella sp.]|nr:MAG: FAD-binding oxidoreductase [Legionella sp.]